MTSFGKAFPVGLNTATTTAATAAATNNNNNEGHINDVPDLSGNTTALGV